MLSNKSDEKQGRRLKILLTNDDGIEAEGIIALEKALRQVADVYVLAPDGNRSAVSNHIIMHKPLRLKKCGENRWSTEGYPVDCVITALRSDLFGVKFDAVFSGINKGANLGTDIVYSGTAAAARQAVLYGMPGIAVSLDCRDDSWNFEPLADFVAKNVESLVAFCTPDAFVNVNASSRGSYDEVAYTSLSRRDYKDSVLVQTEPDGFVYAYFSGGNIQTAGAEDSDYHAVQAGKISVSRVFAEPSAEKPCKTLHSIVL